MYSAAKALLVLVLLGVSYGVHSQEAEPMAVDSASTWMALAPAPSSEPRIEKPVLEKVVPHVRRHPVSRSRPLLTGWAASRQWAHSWAALVVAHCESTDNPRAVNPSGKYRGKWQVDADFWKTYGGLRFARRAELATEAQQDYVAYHGWLKRGWEPWECSNRL